MEAAEGNALNATNANQQRFYEQLGAPVLLYRNRETYTVFDEDPRLCNAVKPGNPANVNVREASAALFRENQLDLHRSTARWYYPIDYHILQAVAPSLPPLVHELCRGWTRPAARKRKSQPRNSGNEGDLKEGSLSSDEEVDVLKQPEASEPPKAGLNENSHSDEEVDVTQNAVNDSYRATLQELMREYDDNEEFRNEVDHEETTAHGSPSTDLQLPDNEKLVDRRPRRLDLDEKQNGIIATPGGSRSPHAQVDAEQHDEPSSEEGGEKEDAATANDGPKLPSFKERNAAVKRAFQNNAYSTQQIFSLQLKARAHMILTGLDGNDKTVRHHARQKLRAYAQLDTNYVPGKVRLKYSNKVAAKKIHRRVLGVTGIIRQQTQLYDRERMNRADPAYMVPFHLPSLKMTTAADIQSRGVPKLKTKAHQELPSIPRDDPNAPTLFGNCILSFPCKCGVCTTGESRQETPVPCLLHPVGPLQDRVRLSFLVLPRGRRVAGHEEPRRHIPEELNVGDRIRQLEQCGSDPYVFVVRTDLHCTVFSVTFVKPRRELPLDKDECWGTVDLKRVHRIDRRTMWRSIPSYRPIDVACHPKYGVGDFTPSKVAVAYESSNGERNVVHHMEIGSECLTVQKHAIANLQDIFEVDFSSHHPMVLWAAARSYVRPALTYGYLYKRPRIGHGASLYSLDLRSKDAATFHWSPSAEEFLPEGIHSVSGIHTDWSKDHCVWASSVSAGKTWELDTRMPCRAVNAWSLPHMCDQFGSVLPPTGLYGAGVLFARPYSVDQQDFGRSSTHLPSGPMLSIVQSPGAFGLHLYQIPCYSPRFQTQSIECTMCPGLSKLGKLSVAASSIFPLPDVSDKVFICGLATFRMPVQNCCEPSSFSCLGYREDDLSGMLCAISLTNKGDIYSHTMLESNASHRQSKSFDCLPVGSSVMPVADTNVSSAGPWNAVRISLSNEFPVPSQSINPPLRLRELSAASRVVDLSTIIDKQANALRLKMLREQRRKTCEKRESQNDGSELPLDESNCSTDSNHQGPNSVESLRRPFDTEESGFDSSSDAGGCQEAATRVSVQLSGPCSAVISTSCTVATNLSLPPHLAQEPTKQGVAHFLQGQKSVMEENSSSNKLWRSDLTPEVLVHAWAEQDYSSDN
jgi:hypothetical protein